MTKQFAPRAAIEAAASALGLDLSARQAEQLTSFIDELLEWNERMNLTAITDPAEIATKHILDSFTAAPLLRSRIGAADGSLIDVGAGGGFPGLPLAIALPTMQTTMIDSTGKKVAFLEHAVAAIGLHNARAAHATAEEAGRSLDHRGRYDAAIARAVGSVATLVELLVPLLRVGGFAVLMKKLSAVDVEVSAAERALAELHASVEEIADVSMSQLPDRGLIVVRKIDETPMAYPRRPGIPRRRPIAIAVNN